MEIKRTFFLSLLLHITFSALLLLSVRFQGENGNMLDEKVFFVSLAADIEKSPAAVTKDSLLKARAVRKVQKKAPDTIVNNKKNDEDIGLNNSALETKEAVSQEALSAYSTNTSSSTDSLDIPAQAENVEYAYSAIAEERTAGTETADDRRGGIFKADALRLITAAIEKAKIYPVLARKREIEGTVYVSFRIMRGGEPDGIRLLRSSGYKILDDTTLKVVKKAAPYPYIDERVEVPVTYRLKD